MFCDPFYIVDKGMSSWEKEVDISVAFVLGLLFIFVGQLIENPYSDSNLDGYKRALILKM